MSDYKKNRNKRLGQPRLSVDSVLDSKKQRVLAEPEDESSTPTIIIVTEEEKESLEENSASIIREIFPPKENERERASTSLSQKQISLFFSPPTASKNSGIFSTAKSKGSNFNFEDIDEGELRIDSDAAQRLQARPRFHGFLYIGFLTLIIVLTSCI
jgi:hypothetical protein